MKNNSNNTKLWYDINQLLIQAFKFQHNIKYEDQLITTPWTV